ncbi:MAG TPA: cbb3-type cytochrome oxidase assembly protein CcoS [Panacibacter sp.]|nr:cbb3-type cytochrome oxidase assembly protein CcoS [Panacibacter sp.]HNP43714.1 cbb3-type cytochrome oxidase assembly protein CcoS [Panacibacter sp.]
MSVIIILLAASISIALLFLVAFILSVKKGQYDDEKSPPVRMLFDDKPKHSNESPRSDA